MASADAAAKVQRKQQPEQQRCARDANGLICASSLHSSSRLRLSRSANCAKLDQAFQAPDLWCLVLLATRSSVLGFPDLSRIVIMVLRRQHAIHNLERTLCKWKMYTIHEVTTFTKCVHDITASKIALFVLLFSTAVARNDLSKSTSVQHETTIGGVVFMEG